MLRVQWSALLRVREGRIMEPFGWKAPIMALGLLLAARPAAAGDCVKPFFYAASGEYSIELKVAKNTPCAVNMKAVFNYRKVEIVRKPKFGTAGVAESGRPDPSKPVKTSEILYIPKRNYVGGDQFKIHLLIEGFGGEAIEQTLNAKVDVVGAN